ncbi:uncharacterized protein LOC132600005 [Lycium barbarum]|uniref:uncharacterized protein LOC132600005 n=1 Tax=Lycium barbarum TaxID=112863 RepID=UPI00293E2490|nr:uncharacterized protein LOC132600005 [Lycium barbarum]
MDSKLRLRDWAGLSDLILHSIFHKLSSISDCLRFSAVCKPWFFFVSKNCDILQQRMKSSSIEELPLLMIFANRGCNSFKSSLYSVAKDTKLLDLELPLPRTQRCCGSSHGWLAFQQHDRTNIYRYNPYRTSIYLYNPFSGETIHLPTLKFRVKKFILSKNPTTNPHNFEVAAISKSSSIAFILAILKPGRKTWIYKRPHASPHDMIYYNERFYVLTYGGGVLSMDNTTLNFEEIAPFNEKSDFKKFYLVKNTNNELLRVEISHPYYNKSSSKISKLIASPTTQNFVFEELDDLGDEALFLCRHSSMSVSASKFPGCESNYIYHMHYNDSQESPLKYYMDIINLQDGRFRSRYTFETSIADSLSCSDSPKLMPHLHSIYQNYFTSEGSNRYRKYIGHDNTTPPVLWIIPTPRFSS